MIRSTSISMKQQLISSSDASTCPTSGNSNGDESGISSSIFNSLIMLCSSLLKNFDYELSSIPHRKFFHDSAHVRFDRFGAYLELLGNSEVFVSFDKKLKHLLFALGQSAYQARFQTRL